MKYIWKICPLPLYYIPVFYSSSIYWMLPSQFVMFVFLSVYFQLTYYSLRQTPLKIDLICLLTVFSCVIYFPIDLSPLFIPPFRYKFNRYITGKYIPYLGCILNRDGVKPDTRKFKYIMDVYLPTSTNSSRAVEWMFQYYKYIW